ncbi:MAG: DNA glycosylase AlkZ-like family protein, partial [Planctomycetota bacterium]
MPSATRHSRVIPPRESRRILLAAQGLSKPPAARSGPASVQRLIERLGFVQVDSINVLERAHHLILQTRLESYRPETLTRLLEKDRSLFEHWTHDASLIPTRWFEHWKPR